MYTVPGLYKFRDRIIFAKQSGSLVWFTSLDGTFVDRSASTNSTLVELMFRFIAPCSSMREARELFPEYFI